MAFLALGVASILMLVAFAIGLHVASSLGLLSFGLMLGFADRPLWEIIGIITWNTNTSFVLVAIPLFILMGQILLESGLSEKMYRLLSLWVNHIPGGLLHSNIAACSVFAAVSGSSVATAATIGKIAMPAFQARGYDERLVAGSLAAGGTLGILIPPSINFIVYGVLMEESIGRLYIAGIIPGIMLTAMFMFVIYIFAIIRPSMAPREPPVEWRIRLLALIGMLPTFILIFIVLGSIYLGVATATESSAFGVTASLVMALLSRRLNLAMLRKVVLSSVRTTAMVMLIVTAALILNSTLAFLGVPYALAQAVISWNLSKGSFLVIVCIFYLVLGTFMDGFAMMVTTIPIILPVLKTLNINLVWFGVVAVILTEAALISPPEGLNLYVIHGLRKDQAGEGSEVNIKEVYLGVMPFFLMMIVALVLIIAFPQIALWLPTTMKGN